MDDKLKSAEIIIKFKAKSICDQEDLDNFYGDRDGISFDEMVRFLIKEEGLWGIVEDDYEIVSIKEIGNGG